MSGTILNDGINAGSMAATLSSAVEVEPFDPVQHTMDEVDGYFDTVGDAERLNELNRVRYLESSRSDGARPTLLDALDNRINIEKDRLETAYGIDVDKATIPEIKAYIERHRDETLQARLEAVRDDETAGQGRSTLLTWVANELTFLQDAVPVDDAEPDPEAQPAPDHLPTDEVTETTEGPTSDENTEPAGDGAEDDTTTEES